MRMQKLLPWAFGAALSFAGALPAQATIITSGSGIASPTNFVNFETTNIANDTVITTQFASSGVTFSGAGAPRYNSCGDGYWNIHSSSLSGDTLNTYGPGCQVNGTDDAFAINFDSVVSEASFGVYLYNGYGGSRFEALLNGVVQDVWLAPVLVNNQYLTFSNILFDEIRYYEGSNQGSNFNYVVLDNLAFNATQVPEPAPLALLGIGLMGLVIHRSRQSVS